MAPQRRLNLNVKGLSVEYIERVKCFDRFKQRLKYNQLVDDNLLLDLLRLYLVLIENDFKNLMHFDIIKSYVSAYKSSQYFVNKPLNSFINSFILWLDYFLLETPSNILHYKPFIFDAQYVC